MIILEEGPFNSDRIIFAHQQAQIWLENEFYICPKFNMYRRLGRLRHLFSISWVLGIFCTFLLTFWLYTLYIGSFLFDHEEYWLKNSSKTLPASLNCTRDWSNRVWGDFGTPQRVLRTSQKEAWLQRGNQLILMKFCQKMKNLKFCEKKYEFGTFFNEFEPHFFGFLYITYIYFRKILLKRTSIIFIWSKILSIENTG